MFLARQVLLWYKSHFVAIKCQFIPGKLNIRADTLSRDGIGEIIWDTVLATEWLLNQLWSNRCESNFTILLVNFFTMDMNAVLPLYFSPGSSPSGAWNRCIISQLGGLGHLCHKVESASSCGSKEVEVLGPAHGSNVDKVRLISLPLPDVRSITVTHKVLPVGTKNAQ